MKKPLPLPLYRPIAFKLEHKRISLVTGLHYRANAEQEEAARLAKAELRCQCLASRWSGPEHTLLCPARKRVDR